MAYYALTHRDRGPTIEQIRRGVRVAGYSDEYHVREALEGMASLMRKNIWFSDADDETMTTVEKHIKAIRVRNDPDKEKPDAIDG
jgi:hypothetical protein